ncbi:MAG: hypothetical protein AAFY47_05520 [Pseudomonadota bacterium]
MISLPNWIVKGTKAIDLEEIAELVEPISKVAEKWALIDEKLNEIGRSDDSIHSASQLVTFLLDNLNDEQVTGVLNALDEGLADKVGKIKTRYEESEWKKLLLPVGQLQEAYLPKSDETLEYNRGTDVGLIDVAIPDKSISGTKALGKLDLTLGISAGAAFELEAGARWPFESDTVDPGLLRLGARGELGVEAGAKLPVAAWLAIGAQGSANASAELGYFFRPKPEHGLFFQSLPPALKGLANPANLRALVKAMAIHQLEGVVMLIEGSASGQAEIDLGQNLALGDVGLQAGFTGSVRYARESRWALSLLKKGAGYQVVLSRLKASEEGGSAALGLSVDVSELAQKANKALDQITDFTGPRLKEIKPFLSPGTYALEKLGEPGGLLDKAIKALSDDATIATALRSDLGLLIGDEAGDDLAIEKALKDKLTASLDEVTGGVTRNASEFADEAIAALVAKLPDVVPDDLKKKGKDEVAKLVKSLVTKFDKTLDDLVADASLPDLANELESLGTRVKTGAKRADRAAKTVRELVAAYEGYVKTTRETLEKLAETEIGLRLESAYSRSESAHYEVMGTITDINDETAQLWHQLALGQLQAIERMLIDPSQVPNGFALSPESSLTQTAASTRSRSIAIDLLGDVFEVQVTATGKAKIIFKDGMVSVDARAQVDRLNSLFGPTRTSSFLSVVELQRFKDGGDARAIDLSVEFLRKDKDLKVKELSIFLSDLAEHNLISAARAQHAKQILRDAWQPSSPKIKGDIGFRLELSPSQLHALLRLGEAAKHHAEVERALFILAARLVIGTHQFSPSVLPKALKTLSRSEDFDVQLAHYWAPNPPLRPGRWGGTSDRQWKTVKPLKTYRPLFEGLATIFTSLYETHSALPKTAFEDGWTVDDYQDKQEKIATAAKPWIKTKANIVSGRLHPSMLTILHIFMALDREPIPQGADEIIGMVERLAIKLEPDAPTSRLQLTMQLGDAAEPTII